MFSSFFIGIGSAVKPSLGPVVGGLWSWSIT